MQGSSGYAGVYTDIVEYTGVYMDILEWSSGYAGVYRDILEFIEIGTHIYLVLWLGCFQGMGPVGWCNRIIERALQQTTRSMNENCNLFSTLQECPVPHSKLQLVDHIWQQQYRCHSQGSLQCDGAWWQKGREEGKEVLGEKMWRGRGGVMESVMGGVDGD